MPDILIRLAQTANSTLQPFDKDAPIKQWKFRRCPYPRGLYTILLRTTGAANNVSAAAEIGTTEVLQESKISVGGTDGVMPTPAGANSTPAHQFYANFNDEVVLTVKETAGATPVTMIWANVEPS
jgi:hypothetical protein